MKKLVIVFAMGMILGAVLEFAIQDYLITKAKVLGIEQLIIQSQRQTQRPQPEVK